MKNEIQDALQALADHHGQRLTADIVIDSAKDKRSPLHKHFPWDVKSAAYEHWKYIARKLISSVHIVYRIENISVTAPVYIRDPDSDPKEQGYVTVSSIKSDEERAREALIDEFKRVRGSLERAQSLAKVLSVDGTNDPIGPLLFKIDDISEELGLTH